MPFAFNPAKTAESQENSAPKHAQQFNYTQGPSSFKDENEAERAKGKRTLIIIGAVVSVALVVGIAGVGVFVHKRNAAAVVQASSLELETPDTVPEAPADPLPEDPPVSVGSDRQAIRQMITHNKSLLEQLETAKGQKAAKQKELDAARAALKTFEEEAKKKKDAFVKKRYSPFMDSRQYRAYQKDLKALRRELEETEKQHNEQVKAAQGASEEAAEHWEAAQKAVADAKLTAAGEVTKGRSTERAVR